jgi:phage terminase large subunit-like protein
VIVYNYPAQQVGEYIEGVLSGDIVAGRLVKLAVQRHLHDLESAWERGFKFDADIATRACAFFPTCLKHSIGEFDGQPFHLFLWEQFCTWSLYGWRRIETNTRRFRRGYITIGRKGGKTTYLAGNALLCQFADEPFEPGAELYVAATKEDQAKIMYREAVRMVKQSPTLAKRARIRMAPNGIYWEEKNSFFRPIGSDSGTIDGLNPHVVLKDELHEWREKHRGMKEKLETGGGMRRQPLDLTGTTAGTDHSELWIEEDAYAVKVLESVVTGNIIDDSYFAYVARIDEEDDPYDEACWPKANPGMPIAPKIEYIREIANEAKNKPASEAKLIRYCCNRRVGSLERAISVDTWMKGAAALTIQDGAYGHGGMDLGRSNDWAAIAACFPIEESGKVVRWELMAKAWTAKDGAFRVDREPFRTWIQRGLLTAHEGNQVDFTEIVREMVAWSEKYQILTWAYDPSFARLAADTLQNVHGLKIFSFTQSHKFYNEPCRRFVEEMDAGRIRHANEPVLEWQARNLEFERNNQGLVMPDKSKKESKIDGLVASLMSFSECLFAEKQEDNFWSPSDGVLL